MSQIKIKPSDILDIKEKTLQKDKKLKKACEDFESIFTYQLLKSMRKTVEKNALFDGGQAEKIYESMLDQEYAKLMSGNSHNSIASMLYQQFKGTAPIDGMNNIDSIQSLYNDSLPQWPLKSSITSKFGWRKDPFTGEKQFHNGIDIAAKEGTPIMASLSGKVLFSDYKKGYGNLVVLDHGHGLTTHYAHNKEVTVNSGDWVTKGSPIASVGSSGRATGPHLHFEARKDGKNLDPMDFLTPLLND